MAGREIRESVTVAGRAERARVARVFVGGVLGPGHPCGDVLAATLSAHRLAAFGVHVLAALSGDDAGWRQEVRLCRCRGDRG